MAKMFKMCLVIYEVFWLARFLDCVAGFMDSKLNSSDTLVYGMNQVGVKSDDATAARISRKRELDEKIAVPCQQWVC